jgi:hypothetical protein
VTGFKPSPTPSPLLQKLSSLFAATPKLPPPSQGSNPSSLLTCMTAASSSDASIVPVRQLVSLECSRAQCSVLWQARPVPFSSLHVRLVCVCAQSLDSARGSSARHIVVSARSSSKRRGRVSGTAAAAADNAPLENAADAAKTLEALLARLRDDSVQRSDTERLVRASRFLFNTTTSVTTHSHLFFPSRASSLSLLQSYNCAITAPRRCRVHKERTFTHSRTVAGTRDLNAERVWSRGGRGHGAECVGGLAVRTRPCAVDVSR